MGSNLVAYIFKRTRVLVLGLAALWLWCGCTLEKPQTADGELEREKNEQLNVQRGTLPVTDRTVKAIAWNLESDGSDPAVIAEQIKKLPSAQIYAFCEVDPAEFERFEKACGQNFKAINSETGRKDRLQIVFDTEQFELVRKMELHEMNYRRRYRSPLVVHLRHKTNHEEFLLMTLHLARGKPEIRQEQAKKLVEWARDQTLPIVALGDFNFDYDFHKKNGNEAFKIFQRDNVWMWIKPKTLIDTNWYDPDGDNVDNFKDSMLDFAFVANSAKRWVKQCEVIVRQGDFPDDKKTSDHRPIGVRFDLPAGLR